MGGTTFTPADFRFRVPLTVNGSLAVPVAAVFIGVYPDPLFEIVDNATRLVFQYSSRHTNLRSLAG